MKGTKKYLFGALIVMVIMTVLCAVVCSVGLVKIREESYRSQLGLVAAVRENTPICPTRR